MNDAGDRPFDLHDLSRVRAAVATVGWGYVLGAITAGPAFVTDSASIGFPSVLGAMVVVVGLSRLPLTAMPRAFARRRGKVVVATSVGWVCGLVSLVPAFGPRVGALGTACSVLSVVLFVALMTQMTEWLGADEPHRLWRRLNQWALALVVIGVPLTIVISLVVPHLSGAGATDTAFSVNGTPVGGVALLVTVAFSIVLLGGIVAALITAIQAFGATSNWLTARLPAVPPTTVQPLSPPDPDRETEAPRTRTVDGRTVLLVDPASQSD